MGGTAVKGKPDVMLKIKKYTKLNSCIDIKSKNKIPKSKILSTDKKFQSVETVTQYKNNLLSEKKLPEITKRSSKNLGNLASSTQDIKKSRNNGKKSKLFIAKESKSQIDAATELDVLKVIKRNNHNFDDHELIEECLVKHFFMRSLEQDARTEIIKEMSLCKIDAETFIFKQDSLGNFFYIIKDGECKLFVNENHIKNLMAGDSFGELALLHGAPRSGSVKTLGVTYVWVLERKNFRKIVEHINEINYEENKRFINSIPILVNIESDLKSILASNLIKVFFDKDKTIVKGKNNYINMIFLIIIFFNFNSIL